MSHFYLTLPSNSSTKYYPGNTLTRYTTRLHSSIDLSGEWEVGLSEITFPHSWLTIERGGGLITVSSNGFSTPELWAMPGFSTDIRLQPGYYESVHEVVREINKSISKIILPIITPPIAEPHQCAEPQPPGPHSCVFPQPPTFDFQLPKLKYNEISKRVHFSMYRSQVINFSQSLATILGLGNKQVPSQAKDEETWSWTGNRVSDITRGINSIFIYCDLLEHVPVGDTKAPLLRIIDARGENGETVHRSFDEPRYVPLQKRNFDSIELDIRDDLGNPVAFENGKLVTTLHFRQAKSPYFLG